MTSAPSGKEIALVLSHGLATVVHDLVGIASAIELRVDVAESVMAPSDGAALRALVQQLRTLSRTARLLQEPDRDSLVNPHRQVTFDEWWALVTSLTHGILPRGIAVEASGAELAMPFPIAASLTQLWLLACEDIAPRMRLRGTGGILSMSAQGTANEITVSATCPRALIRTIPKSMSRWQRQAERTGAPMHAQVAWWSATADLVSWQCVLPLQCR